MKFHVEYFVDNRQVNGSMHIRYDTIRYIYVRSKADEKASLI